MKTLLHFLQAMLKADGCVYVFINFFSKRDLFIKLMTRRSQIRKTKNVILDDRLIFIKAWTAWVHYLKSCLKTGSGFCLFFFSFNSKAATRGFLQKNIFLKNSQNSQENTCARVNFLIKFRGKAFYKRALLKKVLWHRCFPANFAKFSITSFLQRTSRPLLLLFVSSWIPRSSLFFSKLFSVK